MFHTESKTVSEKVSFNKIKRNEYSNCMVPTDGNIHLMTVAYVGFLFAGLPSSSAEPYASMGEGLRYFGS